MNNTTNNNGPIDSIKNESGLIEVPIWKNENEEGKVSYSTSSAKRSYFDKQEQEYKNTTALYGADNLEVAELYRRAYDRIRELKEVDYQASKADGEQAA